MRKTWPFWLFPAAFLLAQDPNGIATVAGQGTPGYSGLSRGAEAMIDTTYGVAVDGFGNLYLADSWNHRIRRVTPAGIISTVAGTGQAGYSNGVAIASMLRFPRAVAVDAKGNVYIADAGNARVRVLRPDGALGDLAGNGSHGFGGDGGLAANAQFLQLRGLAVDKAGNVYVADSGNYRVRRITPSLTISTVAGNGTYGYDGDGGQAASARIGMPYGLALDADGGLLLADPYNHVVRRVAPSGVISTVSGTGRAGDAGGPTRTAQLRQPRGVAADTLGNFYIADTGNNAIRRVTGGVQSTAAGGLGAGFDGDGRPASQARFDVPYAVATDPRGNVYVADLMNYRVRKARLEALTAAPEITPGGVVSAADFVSAPSGGGLFSVFGKNFGYRSIAASSLPLDRLVEGLSLTINGVATPIVFASPTQINAQIPWMVSGAATIQVNFGGVESVPVNFQAPQSSPAAFVTPERRAIVVNQSGTINSPALPAPRGSVLVFYATGLGPVSSRPADGAASGRSPLSATTLPTVVRFGNSPGTVLFSGLTPDFVGLWQVNVLVPPNAPIGADVLSEIQVGGTLSRAFLVSIQGAP